MFSIVAVLGWEYARWTYATAARAQQIVFGLEEKPFVYRALVPFVAWLLVQTGIPAELALRIVITLSVCGLFYAFLYLFRSFKRS